jgi:DNA-binding SARP family transcriptional activator
MKRPLRVEINLNIRVFGDVEIQTDNVTVALDRAAERCVLATFALNPGRPVHADTLVENVWGELQPAKAEQTVAHYVRAVRRAIELAGGHRDWLRNRRPRSYELHVEPAVVDYHRFTALVRDAQASARDGFHRDAIVSYEKALDLWRGEPLANIGSEWADRCRHAIRQEQMDALCALLDQQLKVGDYAPVATRVGQLITDVVPTDRLIELGMCGLAYGGDRAMIPGFFARAAQRMWDAAQVRPSPAVDAIARRLVVEPKIPSLSVESTAGPWTEEEPTEGVGSSQDGDTDQPASTDAQDSQPRGGSITMTALFNANVYQAGGDQYITDHEG